MADGIQEIIPTIFKTISEQLSTDLKMETAQ
jgi:hypothetical protein